MRQTLKVLIAEQLDIISNGYEKGTEKHTLGYLFNTLNRMLNREDRFILIDGELRIQKQMTFDSMIETAKVTKTTKK